MDKKRLSDLTKLVITGLGILVTVVMMFSVPTPAFGLGYFVLLGFAIFLAPRMSLTLPRSNLIISFSDSIIFLTFLIYGGEMAIVTAFVETFGSCVYLKRRRIESAQWFVLFNSSLAALVTATSVGVLALFSRIAEYDAYSSSTRTLVVVLGILSLTQFFTSSIFAAVYQSLTGNSGIWETWKKQGLSSSLTQFTGAALAGAVYKLFSYSDPLVTAIATVGLILTYLSYRQSIGQVNEATNHAEEAEREKAEAERELRREAEQHAGQLALSLEKEEMANEALRKSEKDLKYAALHDSLTDLANRKQLGDILRHLIRKYQDDPATTFHVLFLDISRFKNINDSLGHTFGDKVLTIVARRLIRMLNPTDVVARIGGDEFAIILKNLSNTGTAQKVARRIYQTLSQPFLLSGNNISIKVNLGIAPCDAEYNTPEDVLRDADIAMHYAKKDNSGVAVFSKEMRFRFLERVRYENDLRQAIDRGELSMNYQPLVNIQDGDLLGFEALLRWHHSEFGNIPPNKFIHIAEDSGLIIPITVWILRQTCTQMVSWQKIDPSNTDLIVSVNISGKHLMHGDLIADVEHALEMSGLVPSCLKLEITESVAMENADNTINVLNRLKQLGVKLSIDDFGTGYSSLSILHRLPFDTLKIDRSFVSNVGENGENSGILQTIISLAKNLRMRVIAEGIETGAQLAVLQNLGCDYGQGYLLARPQTVDNLEQMLYQRKSWLPSVHLPEQETIDVHAGNDIAVYS